MKASVVFCVVFISIGTAEIWRVKQQTSEWNFQTDRIHVDIANSVHSINASSLIGCVSFCSSFDGINPTSLLFNMETGKCSCHSTKSTADETRENKNEPQSIYGIRRMHTKVERTERSLTRTTVLPFKQDCSDLYENLFTKDGLYVIQPPGGHITDTWCDMTNGGWTVIQRRMDGSEDFYRGWNDYVNGFGNKNGEYWLGLENMHRLTRSGSQLVVHMKAFPGVTPSSMTAHYSNFHIGDADSMYTLNVEGFTGTCGDSLSLDNGLPFTTFDNDNDNSHKNCAKAFRGGWWYHACHESHLNGLYYHMGEYDKTSYATFAKGIHWNLCWYRKRSAMYAIMKIKGLS